MSTVRAPWTDEQVAALNDWQTSGRFHPFTCCTEGTGCRDRLGTDNNERALAATNNGWVCPTCDYTQDWAHDFMFEPIP